MALSVATQENATAPVHPLTELPSFRPTALGVPGEDAIDAFERDGVVCLREAFPKEWVDAVARGMDIAQGGEHRPGFAFTITEPGEPGYFFYDTFMYQRIDEFRRFYRESPAADLAMNILRSNSVIFYFDFMLVKEPGTSAKTPWHYDEAYWPISGNQMCNLWMVVEPTPVETTLRFVRGSHRWTANYRLMSFDPRVDYPDPPDDPAVPDWDFEPVTTRSCMRRSSPATAWSSTTEPTIRRRAIPCARSAAGRWRRTGSATTSDSTTKPHSLDPPHRAGLTHGGSMECRLFPRVR